MHLEDAHCCFPSSNENILVIALGRIHGESVRYFSNYTVALFQQPTEPMKKKLNYIYLEKPLRSHSVYIALIKILCHRALYALSAT